ncbi:MAG: urate oxidase [Acidobacteriaceae bacterium]|nr:urate oxidase [Acidobacteriaceae bacterium]
MTAIQSDAYGKTRVRLTYVDRDREPHQVRELSIGILFEGDFSAAYTHGDNSRILPTDTMKNTVYVLARQLSWDSAEVFAQGIAKHFLDRLQDLLKVTVDIEEIPWQHIPGQNAAFLQSGNERRTAKLRASRSAFEASSGLKDLQILKTSDSGFSGFLRDEYTTLAETDDRLFGTVLQAQWRYLGDNISFNEAHRQIRRVLLESFARHASLSVQHTLFAMGQAVLEQVGDVSNIHLVMPNKHCLLVDLARFGIDNPNRVFVPTDEPSGYIEARIVR